MARRCFCDINPFCYKLSVKKGIFLRNCKDFFSREKIAKEKSPEKLPVVVFDFHSNMIKRAPGVDLTSQLNKAVNIDLASQRINGIVIHPGETFSFWRTIGTVTKKKGYKEGRIIFRNKLKLGIGGGLCNLGNTVNRIVLHSPMAITEFHKHSDALAPDEGERVPLSAGTAVSYNYIDYRFKNNTDQDVQLLLWVEGEELYGQLRAEKEFPHTYHLEEEDHHFRKEGDKYYRVSKLYRVITDRTSAQVVEKELIWDNHSEVLFDYSLIPQELIRPYENVSLVNLNCGKETIL